MTSIKPGFLLRLVTLGRLFEITMALRPHPPGAWRLMSSLGKIVAFAAFLSACQQYPPALQAGPPPSNCPVITNVEIVSQVDSNGNPDASRKFVRQEQQVTMYAIVTTESGVRFTSAPLRSKKNVKDGDHWPAECPVSLQWYKVEAQVESYNNAYSAPPAEILMEETTWKSGWSTTADVHPTLMHDEFADDKSGLGTMRFKVTANLPDGTSHSSPGIESRETGAPDRKIHTVVYRKDNSYIGYLYELYNTPYIYGSKRIKGGHQSDLQVGSDCADLTIYAKRRQRGKKRFPYTYTGGLRKYAARYWRISLDDQNYYLDKKGKRMSFGEGKTIRPGDLINFDAGHVGILIKDDGDGFLDLDDFVMHTLVREPETVPIKDCRWGGIDGKEIIRLKD
jgi:hypothetical protein